MSAEEGTERRFSSTSRSRRFRHVSDDPTAQVFVMTPFPGRTSYRPLVPEDDPLQRPPSIRAVLIAAGIVIAVAAVSAFLLKG